MEDAFKKEIVEVSEIQDEKTFNRNKWLFSIPGIGRDMLYTLVSSYFLQYIQFGVMLSPAQFTTVSLLIGIAGRIWDGINDPMMGTIIDGSHLKMGKFKPWILIGALIDATLTLVLFNLARFMDFSQNKELLGWVYVGIICFVYLLWEAAFTMNDIGYWSMIPSLSRTKDRRDTLTSLTVFFAGVGTIIMTAGVSFAPGNVVDIYSIFSVVACLAVIIGQTIVALKIKEAPREDRLDEGISFKRMVKTIVNNKQLLWMSLALLCSSAALGIIVGLIYNIYYMEVGYNGAILAFVVIYGVCNTFLQILYPKLAKKYGRKKIQFISFFCMLFGFAGMALIGWWKILPMNIITICIFSLFIFGGNTLFYTAEVINMNNCVEYNEYITGERNESVVTTMRPLIVKFGDAIKYLAVTLALVGSGLYDVQQNVAAIENEKSTFGEYVFKASSTKTSAERAKQYIEGYFDIVEATTTKEKEEIVDNNIALYECKFDIQYTEAYGKMYLLELSSDKKNVENGWKINEMTSTDDIDENHYYQIVISPTNDYKYEVEKKVNDDDVIYNNAADEIYATNTKLSTRITLRLVGIVLPCLLMFLCMIIQRKKFIIDEKFYEELLLKNAERAKEKKTNK